MKSWTDPAGNLVELVSIKPAADARPSHCNRCGEIATHVLEMNHAPRSLACSACAGRFAATMDAELGPAGAHVDVSAMLRHPRSYGATFSGCGTWRYTLWNRWDRHAPQLGYVGCNPSDAGTEEADGSLRWDHTARKFDGFARRHEYGGWCAANLFALVSTDPAGLRSFDGDPVGPEGDAAILRLSTECDDIVLCWGAIGGVFRARAEHVVGMLAGASLWCFGLTRAGHPVHPSRLPYATPLVPFEEAVAQVSTIRSPEAT